MKIVFLPKKDYKYFELCYEYEAEEYYNAKVNSEKDAFSFEFVREKLPQKLERTNYDTLYQPYWTNCRAYALEDGEEFLAFFELDRVYWNSTLRITQLLVKKELRRSGIGKKIMTHVKKIAEKEDFRQIIVETQSCNIGAIDFYLSCGFTFTGTNVCFYSNDDIGEREVMIEMSYLL